MSLVPTFLRNLFPHRPEALQVGALCLRETGDMIEILLVSSLDSGRMIVPKGWPMRGRTLAEAALREAWEEAGVKGTVSPEPLGSYSYAKRLKSGLEQPCTVTCFRISVDSLADDYPEAGRRKRVWLTPKAAAKQVREPELKTLLRSLERLHR